ncbi:MAG: sigma-70 family RNA polymerase sigma factor [Chloroflexota bacterium]
MDLSAISDREAIVLAQNGNQDAFAVLYQRNLDAIYRYIHKRVGEVYESENITQTVFAKAWMALDRYKPTVAPFRAWLYRIAHNAVVDHYRKHKETVPWDDLSVIPDERRTPEEVTLSQERSEQVQEAMEHIKPVYKDVLSYRFLYNMDYDETAQALDRKVNAVRVLQHRALNALQKALNQQAVTWIAILAAFASMGIGIKAIRSTTNALPGDALYTTRIDIEDTLLTLVDDSGDARLYTNYTARRLVEIEMLIAADRVDDVQIAVARLTAHLTGMETSLRMVAQTDPELAQELVTTLGPSLNAHRDTLVELLAGGSESLNAALQPAIDATEKIQSTIQEVVPQPTGLDNSESNQHQELDNSEGQLLPAPVVVNSGDGDNSDVIPSIGDSPHLSQEVAQEEDSSVVFSEPVVEQTLEQAIEQRTEQTTIQEATLDPSAQRVYREVDGPSIEANTDQSVGLEQRSADIETGDLTQDIQDTTETENFNDSRNSEVIASSEATIISDAAEAAVTTESVEAATTTETVEVAEVAAPTVTKLEEGSEGSSAQSENQLTSTLAQPDGFTEAPLPATEPIVPIVPTVGANTGSNDTTSTQHQTEELESKPVEVPTLAQGERQNGSQGGSDTDGPSVESGEEPSPQSGIQNTEVADSPSNSTSNGSGKGQSNRSRPEQNNRVSEETDQGESGGLVQSASDPNSSGEVDSGEENSGEENSEQRRPRQGETRRNESGQNNSGQGESRQNDSGEGDSGEGGSGQGDSGQGDSGQGRSDQGGPSPSNSEENSPRVDDPGQSNSRQNSSEQNSSGQSNSGQSSSEQDNSGQSRSKQGKPRGK